MFLSPEFVTGPQKGFVHLDEVLDGQSAERTTRKGVFVEHFQSALLETFQTGDVSTLGDERILHQVQADRANCDEISVPEEFVVFVFDGISEMLK